MNKTEIIKTLMEIEKTHGLTKTINHFFGKTNIKVNVGFSKTACNASIDDLSLSVRSYNALRRANVSTLGELIELLNEGSLKGIRNLGAKSYSEIQTRMLVYGFDMLSEKEKCRFFMDLAERNCG